MLPQGGSHFVAWLHRNGYWVSSAAKKPAAPSATPGVTPEASTREASTREASPRVTHVFLTGGKAAVPAYARGVGSGMVRAYAADAAEGRPVHAVERTFGEGGTYNMFADLDVPSEAPVGAAELEALVLEALEGAPDALLGPGAADEVVVLTREWHGGKTGAHMVWSDGDHRVDDAVALALRDAWVDRLERRIGRRLPSGDEQWSEGELEAPGASPGAADAAGAAGRPPARDWGKIIDPAVYRSNGLRMPWSLKARGGDRRTAYVPTHVARRRADGTVELAHVGGCPAGSGIEWFMEWVARCSLMARHPGERGRDGQGQGTRDHEVSPRFRGLVGLGGMQRRKRAGGTAGTGLPRAGCAAVAVTLREASVASDASDASEGLKGGSGLAEGELELPEVYRGTRLGAAYAATCRGRSVVVVPCSGRYCHGVGREHRSNHVWFELHRGGAVYQRCHGQGERCKALRVLLVDATHRLAAHHFPPTVPSVLPVTAAGSVAAAFAKLNLKLKRG